MTFEHITGAVRVGYRVYSDEEDIDIPSIPVSNFYWETDVIRKKKVFPEIGVILEREVSHKRGKADNLDNLSHALRCLEITPDQIDNIGTYHPLITDTTGSHYVRQSEPLSERLLKGLIHSLQRPIVRIIKRNNPGFNPDEDDMLDYPYQIGIGVISKDYILSEIIDILDSRELPRKDVLFFEEQPREGYAPLNNLHRDYISNLTGLKI